MLAFLTGKRKTMGQSSSRHGSAPSSAPHNVDDEKVDGGRTLPVAHVYASTPQPDERNRHIVQHLILERRLAPFTRGLEDYEQEWGPDELDEALRHGEAEGTSRVDRAVADAREEMRQRAEARNEAAAAAAASAAAAAAATANVPSPPAASLSSTPPAEPGSSRAMPVLPHDPQPDPHPDPQQLPPRMPQMPPMPPPHMMPPPPNGVPFGAPGGRRKEREPPVPPILSNPPHMFPYGPGERERHEEMRLYADGAAECPICFLYYAPMMNRSRCCHQPICTECFIQIKRADPTVTNPTSEPACCPFCQTAEFGVTYEAPRPPRDGGGSPRHSEFARSEGKRRKSIGQGDIVLTDHIHPNWEAKLQAVQATIARRANRRIVFRQVGDRLIPIGITSGRPPPEGMPEEQGRDPARRGGARRPNFIDGQDLEELMVMEAIRVSLLEQEARDKKEREEREKKEREGGGSPVAGPSSSSSSAGPSAIAELAARSLAASTLAAPAAISSSRDSLDPDPSPTERKPEAVAAGEPARAAAGDPGAAAAGELVRSGSPVARPAEEADHDQEAADGGYQPLGDGDDDDEA